MRNNLKLFVYLKLIALQNPKIITMIIIIITREGERRAREKEKTSGKTNNRNGNGFGTAAVIEWKLCKV